MHSMNQFDRLEALAQRVIEGTFSRFSRAKPDTPENDNIDSRAAQRTETKEVLSVAAVDKQMAGRWALQLEGRYLQLGEPVVNIGRALDNEIVLNDPAVSRYHAQLRWREGRYYLYPPRNASGGNVGNLTQQIGLSSPHTLVNRQPVADDEQHPLAAGDEVIFGKTTVTVAVSVIAR